MHHAKDSAHQMNVKNVLHYGVLSVSNKPALTAQGLRAACAGLDNIEVGGIHQEACKLSAGWRVSQEQRKGRGRGIER